MSMFGVFLRDVQGESISDEVRIRVFSWEGGGGRGGGGRYAHPRAIPDAIYIYIFFLCFRSLDVSVIEACIIFIGGGRT